MDANEFTTTDPYAESSQYPKDIWRRRIFTGKFVYEHSEDYFNHETYVSFLEDFVLPVFYKGGHKMYLIHDNASYHKKPETEDWFEEHEDYILPFNLPPYSPELNAIERIWHYVRMKATHNRYFSSKEILCKTLFSTFEKIQRNPKCIMGACGFF